MKFFVLGCNGMAGHTISLYLKEQGHKVVGFARNKSDIVETVEGDAFASKSIIDAVKKGNYDSVVNCIGILNQNAEEKKAEAVYLNAYLPHLLEDITDKTGTQIIHMSTDCVFSGKSGQYTENDLRDGERFYDRSKALGEIENNKDFTIRTSIVGPDRNSGGMGLLNWFLQQNHVVQGYSRVLWTGITTLQLAKLVEQIAEKRAHGLFNLVPEEKISKYDLLLLFNRYLRNDSIQIIANEKLKIDKSLRRTNYQYDFGIPEYKVMVDELSEWMLLHRKLYLHYDLKK